MPKHIYWAEEAAEWAEEAAYLKETEGVDSRAHRIALQNLRSAERHLEAEQEKQAERDRYEKMTPREVAREVVDRAMNGR